VTVTVEQDFREFVVARWGELEPVAQLVTLDDAAAREITVEALAELHGQWGHLLDQGAPGATARQAVLTRSLDAARRHPTGHQASHPDGRPAVRHRDGLDPASDDAVLLALVGVLRAATPLERAVLGADTTWGLDHGRVADLVGLPPAQARDADVAVRARLLAAHTQARAGSGWEPAEWALDRDLTDALDLLLTERPDPPDAVALVGERRRQVQRRSVVLGAGAALGAAAVAGWGAQSVLTGASTPPAPVEPGPGDPVWSMTSTWPARGRLATDPQVLALVAGASPRARLLWADDLGGKRVVVAATAEAGGVGGTLVRMWSGPRGASAGSLSPTGLVRDRVAMLDDVVPLAVDPGVDDEDGAGAVLLLARPTVLEASYSSVVGYARGGGTTRHWAVVPLTDGVATVALPGPMPPAFRVRLDGYDGGPLGATPVGLPPPSPSGPLAASLLDALGPFVAACTGLPVSALTSRIVLEAPVPGDVLTPLARGDTAGTGRVVVAHTRLPDGTVLRSVRVAGDGHDEVPPMDVETTRVIAPAESSVPFATRLPAFEGDVSRFLVVAPGAARAQLVGTSSNTYPASEVSPVRDGTGVLEVADARRAALYRLVIWDASGRRLGAWDSIFRRRDPRDLWPRVR
jgi:hypothetical protein